MMCDVPAVSLIIPVRETSPDILLEKLRALHDGEFTDFEIIIVDDCSPVDMRPFTGFALVRDCLRLDDPIPFNMPAAKNAGARVARGDWLMFSDVDVVFGSGEIRRLIEESIRYTRSLVFELSPPILYDLGFEPAMEWLAEHMQQQYGLVVSVEDDDLPKPLDNEARALLFRAVRELLFNVLKHAQASCARVCMRRAGEHLEIIVEDNGVGFAPDQLGASSGKIEGFGLFSIRERLNYFGGRMEIESTPGEVTRVTLSLPLRPGQKKRTNRMAAPTLIRVASPRAASKAVAPPPAKPRPSSSAALR